MLIVLSKEVSSCVFFFFFFFVFGMNRPGIELWSPGLLANILTIMAIGDWKITPI